MYAKHLQQLGYSENESKIILALNKYGAMPASTISRVTEIKRTSVYNLLITLQEKSLISSYHQDSHILYFIDDLKKLYYLEREKLMVAKDLVENLRKKSYQAQDIKVNYYRGQEGYFEVYNDMLRRNTDEILCWVDFRFLSIIKPKDEEQYLQERISKNIPARILMIESAEAKKFKKDDHKLKRETRLLGKEFTFETTIFLYDGHMALFDFNEPITAVRIAHPGIYKMFRQIFDLHWENS